MVRMNIVQCNYSILFLHSFRMATNDFESFEVRVFQCFLVLVCVNKRWCKALKTLGFMAESKKNSGFCPAREKSMFCVGLLAFC